MILKILLVIGVIGIVYFMFIKKKPLKNTDTNTKKKEKFKDNEMVECAQCSVYVEVSESILSGAKYYCSSECRDKAV